MQKPQFNKETTGAADQLPGEERQWRSISILLKSWQRCWSCCVTCVANAATSTGAAGFSEPFQKVFVCSTTPPAGGCERSPPAKRRGKPEIASAMLAAVEQRKRPGERRRHGPAARIGADYLLRIEHCIAYM